MTRLDVALIFSLLMLAACSSSNSSPTIKLTMPSSGAMFSYDENNTDVDVSFTTSGITLKDAGTCAGAANCGHVELFLDSTTCNDHSDPANPQPFNNAASSSPSHVGLDYCPSFPSVTGTHTIKAELHKDDLMPILGSAGLVVSDSVTFMATPSPVDMAGPPDLALNSNCGTAANPIVVGPDHGFAPLNCGVAAGSTVHWTWATGGTHSVTEDSAGGFDSTVLNGGATFTFAVPSTMSSGAVIPYHCTLHGSVTGSVCTGMCAQLTVQ